MPLEPVIFVYSPFLLDPDLNDELRRRGKVYLLPELEGEALGMALSESEILVIPGGCHATRELLDSMPKLKLITNFGVGYDGIDTPAALQRGIVITHTPGAMDDDVADLTVALLLNCIRQFIEAHKFVERGDWITRHGMQLTPSLKGMKIGMAGIGRIGQEIAARLLSFKTEIAYQARHHHPELPYTCMNSLEELASWCDALILAMPGSPSNYHLVNAGILKKLGPRGFLINIARGSIVDTQALITALDQGWIAGAGLDVFEQEPEVPQALMNRPNVVLTPHAGSNTYGTRHNMAVMVLNNLDAWLEGRPLPNLIPECRHNEPC